jgi:hypothetical protein
MATSTGTSLSLKSFIDQFIAFAVSNAGFVDSGIVAMSGNIEAHSLTKGAVTWVFTTALSSEYVYSSGVSFMQSRMCYSSPVAGSVWSTTNPVGQPGMTRFSIYKAGLTFASPHWFFTNGNSCHAVLEIFPNIFSHFSFGTLEKYGTYTGGEYLTCTDISRVLNGIHNFNYIANQYIWAENTGGNGSLYTGYIRYSRGGLDKDDFSPLGNGVNNISGGNPQNAKGIVNPGHADSTPGDGVGFCGAIFSCSPNAANLRSPLIPIYIRLRDVSSVSSQYHLAGYPEGVRMINIKELDPKEIVDNDWQVFPLAQKLGDSSVAAISNKLALAYNTQL